MKMLSVILNLCKGSSSANGGFSLDLYHKATAMLKTENCHVPPLFRHWQHRMLSESSVPSVTVKWASWQLSVFNAILWLAVKAYSWPSWPNEASMHRPTQPSLEQIMPCRVLDAKPLSDAMLAYCQLYPKEQTSIKCHSKSDNVHWKSNKWISKCYAV